MKKLYYVLTTLFFFINFTFHLMSSQSFKNPPLLEEYVKNDIFFSIINFCQCPQSTKENIMATLGKKAKENLSTKITNDTIIDITLSIKYKPKKNDPAKIYAVKQNILLRNINEDDNAL